MKRNHIARANRLVNKPKVYKNKKAYSRKVKHKKFSA